MENDLQKYRNYLVQAEQKSLESYDKSLLTLSGGALAISLAFIGDIVGPSPIQSTGLLITAWALWVASIAGTIASFFISHLALRKTIRQVDNDVIYKEKPGGAYTTITNVLNVMDGGMFVLGLYFIVKFASVNMR